MLNRLNPDYVQAQALDPKSHNKLLLNEQRLKDTFRNEVNARLWLYSQIMKCVMMAQTVAPDADMVGDFASAIYRLHGNRPIAHIALFFGYAQVGQRYGDEYREEHYGAFNLSNLLGDLARHLRIAAQRGSALRRKIESHRHEVEKWTEIAEGRIPIYEELVNRMPPKEREREMRTKGLTEADLCEEAVKAAKQRHIDYAKQMLQMLMRNKDF